MPQFDGLRRFAIDLQKHFLDQFGRAGLSPEWALA